MYPYQIQGSRITIVVNTRPWTLAEGQVGYSELRQAIKDKNWDIVPNLVSPRKVVVSYTNGSNVTIENDVLCYKGVELCDGIATRILSMREEGFDITPMTNFLERVMQNPSTDSRTELFEFLDKNDLPITEDGYFLAYKRVREDYKDVHSGTIRNVIGDKPSMERSAVDANRRNECSVGLHFCSFGYLKHFRGEHTMILKIDPADVVSIPNDYDRAKGRCYRYEVVGEVEDPSVDVLSNGPSVVATTNAPKVDTYAKLSELSQRGLYRVAMHLDPAHEHFRVLSDERIRNVDAAIQLIVNMYTGKQILDAVNAVA